MISHQRYVLVDFIICLSLAFAGAFIIATVL